MERQRIKEVYWRIPQNGNTNNKRNEQEMRRNKSNKRESSSKNIMHNKTGTKESHNGKERYSKNNYTSNISTRERRLICVYGPNKDEKTELKDEFSKSYKALAKMQKKIYFLGNISMSINNNQTGYKTVKLGENKS